jgi:hypothetical protein
MAQRVLLVEVLLIQPFTRGRGVLARWWTSHLL